MGQWEDFPEIDVFAKTDDDLFRAAITSHPLIAAPGSRFYYSSPGYWLLAQIIEKAAGCSYSEFLARAVLEPAELADTFVGSPGQRTNVASVHIC